MDVDCMRIYEDGCWLQNVDLRKQLHMKCDCSFQQQLVLAARFLTDLWNRSANGEAKREKYSENCLNWKQDEVSSIRLLFRTTLHRKKIWNASEDNKWLKGFKAFQAFSALSVSVISIAGDGIQRIPTCQGWTFFDTTQGYSKSDRNSQVSWLVRN